MEKVVEETTMTKVKRWFSSHKEIIFAAGAFVLGCVVKGAIDKSKYSDLNTSLKIYNGVVEYSNNHILPDLNRKYENIDFNKNPDAQEEYETEYENLFNAAVVREIRKNMGIVYNVTVDDNVTITPF